MSEDLKNPSVDTPVDENTGETGEGQGTVDTNKVDTTKKVETEPTEEVVSKKELEKAHIRENQLKNEIGELTTAINKGGDTAEFVKELQSKISELETRETERVAQDENERVQTENENKAKDLFERKLSKYPEKVQKIARATFGKNPWVAFGDFQYWMEAEDNLTEKLNAIEDNLGGGEKQVEKNNPVTEKTKKEFSIAEGTTKVSEGEAEMLEEIYKDSFGIK